MEEYEVDLRDYLLVMWRWKWLILGVLFLALLAAGAATLLAPDVYQSEAILAITSPLETICGRFPYDVVQQAFVTSSASDENSEENSSNILEYLSDKCRDPALLAAAAREAGMSSSWLESHLVVNKKSSSIVVTLRGQQSPQKLAKALGALVSRLDAGLSGQLKEYLSAKATEAKGQLEALSQELEGWQERLTQARSQALSQRKALTAAIDQLRSDKEAAALSVGDQTTLAAYAMRKELDLLYARLQAVELELDDLDRLGVLALPGAETRIPELEASIEAAKREQSRWEALAADPPSLISVQGPTSPAAPVRPSLKMNLAVAGVLGLFLGVLIAFFLNWWQAGSSETDQPESD